MQKGSNKEVGEEVGMQRITSHTINYTPAQSSLALCIHWNAPLQLASTLHYQLILYPSC